MATVNVHAAKTQLSKLLDQAEAGDEVIIARAGKPVARLVAIAPPKPTRTLGLLAGKLRLRDDFDAPLPDDVLADFEAR
jgi:prevent-host-death family protein